ncbi:hypothetical protein [Nocardioides szechwanensis]|uniref:hypothetical protein n=1 Tax=Nocardioides szechwanensis TaxID=1005944 RepID=UPI000B89D673|nr:hypothetical protein [Nocardioides szechwanensis]
MKPNRSSAVWSSRWAGDQLELHPGDLGRAQQQVLAVGRAHQPVGDEHPVVVLGAHPGVAVQRLQGGVHAIGLQRQRQLEQVPALDRALQAVRRRVAQRQPSGRGLGQLSRPDLVDQALDRGVDQAARRAGPDAHALPRKGHHRSLGQRVRPRSHGANRVKPPRPGTGRP